MCDRPIRSSVWMTALKTNWTIRRDKEEGWPLGLQPLNMRIGLGRSRDFSAGSTSFNTSLSESLTSSTDSSSDLDTESTGSFFHDRSTTLGSLIGVSSIVNNLSRRSTRSRSNGVITNVQKNYRSKTTWCFSLCPRNNTDAESVMMIRNNDSSNTPSLGHFLAVERRANANGHRRSHNHSPLLYGPDEFAMALPNRDQNSLFANGQIAPPQLSPWSGSDVENRQRANRELEHDVHGQGAPLLFPCMCG
ncbi:uncharacterized protein LOC107790918 isoform X3 [Nicotiana tabacum]|uniref:Uncharacterized protein At3g17950-like isoform X3 n=4 Tax=Nicotiana TaxID=4085 RepID=A0A1S3ZVM4_TOBAC|nr:PREDICTED: uncharacterized protein At3g17950-like isoform X3 [Nicotiana sylvestris]XP_009790265.1 PREDICTED: uncharacterized protein At3g17950-like isoform X3 [Nicotiana sylvestris]XP_016468379.1 PREDICTED: uncharacterized protein At3g17950-like isoform X3 [Nicotiana tabacum]XP_016468380.1 PREDICTED: uncharacterized protein At3g17950-like isoform X3 [Nicotiana tabacum]